MNSGRTRLSRRLKACRHFGRVSGAPQETPEGRETTLD